MPKLSIQRVALSMVACALVTIVLLVFLEVTGIYHCSKYAHDHPSSGATWILGEGCKVQGEPFNADMFYKEIGDALKGVHI